MPSAKTRRGVSQPAAAHLQEAPLRELVAAGLTREITAVGQRGHFTIEVGLGDGHAVLANAQNQVRTFAALSTVAVFLARLGCHEFAVNTTKYEPGRVRPAQPERSAAMKEGRLPKRRKAAAD
jgi:hypothetical protein